jgi:hypothetical protein
VAADIFITRTTDAIIGNYKDKERQDAMFSQVAVENAQRLGLTPDAQGSSKRNTRDKHQSDHPSRTGDKLRKRETWKNKKFSGKGNKERKIKPNYND